MDGAVNNSREGASEEAVVSRRWRAAGGDVGAQWLDRLWCWVGWGHVRLTVLGMRHGLAADARHRDGALERDSVRAPSAFSGPFKTLK